MPTLIERYQSGEHEQVWADLVSFGPRVREKQYLPDAQAVAQETMRRARHNVETLIVRLEKLGYEFQTAERDARESLHGLNRAMGLLKTVDKLTAGSDSNPVVEKMRQRNRAMPDNPLFKGMLGWLQQSAAKAAPADPLKNPDVYSSPTERVPKDLARCEKSIGGPLPLSLRAWCEIVGSVSLMGSHPVLCFREGGEGTPLTMYMNPDLFQFGSGRAQLEEVRAAGVNVVTKIPVEKKLPLRIRWWSPATCEPGTTRATQSTGFLWRRTISTRRILAETRTTWRCRTSPRMRRSRTGTTLPSSTISASPLDGAVFRVGNGTRIVPTRNWHTWPRACCQFEYTRSRR
jgi:hypothetical protein